jgi:hypothetical protein
MSKAKAKKSNKTSEQLRKAALAVTTANLARIEARERGEKGGKPERDTTTLAEFFPHPGRGKGSGKSARGSKADGKAQSAKAVKPKKAKRTSGLDAAAKVLTESKEPLNAQDIVKAMADKGYWKSPGGKTPHATIYAAMIREIKDKGREARFVKKDRGLFAAAKGA